MQCLALQHRDNIFDVMPARTSVPSLHQFRSKNRLRRHRTLGGLGSRVRHRGNSTILRRTKKTFTPHARIKSFNPIPRPASQSSAFSDSLSSPLQCVQFIDSSYLFYFVVGEEESESIWEKEEGEREMLREQRLMRREKHEWAKQKHQLECQKLKLEIALLQQKLSKS